MPYNPTDWKNKPSTETPINANNLNKIETCLTDITAEHVLNFYAENVPSGSGVLVRVGALCQLDLTLSIEATMTGQYIYSIPAGYKPAIGLSSAIFDKATGTYGGIANVINGDIFIDIPSNTPSIYKISFTYLTMDN